MLKGCRDMVDNRSPRSAAGLLHTTTCQIVPSLLKGSVARFRIKNLDRTLFFKRIHDGVAQGRKA